MFTRREMLRTAAQIGAFVTLPVRDGFANSPENAGVEVNDELGTNGQVYWSDRHQLSSVFEGYRKAVAGSGATEMITEAYVTRDALLPFLGQVRKDRTQRGIISS